LTTEERKELIEQLKNLAVERAGGSPSDSNYDPELLDVMWRAAEELELYPGITAFPVPTVPNFPDLLKGE
jgi:hypothetical protein